VRPHGQQLLDEPNRRVELIKSGGAANEFVTDIKRQPHAFVLGCVMDRQIKAERAWRIPYELSGRIGGFSMDRLRALSKADVGQVMQNPTPLHRFPEKMSGSLYLAIQHIANKYDGDASRIWSNSPSSSIVVYRFLEFKGVGPKIATMAANILARDFKIQFADYYSIDISVDVHIKRVFARLGLCPANAKPEQIIYMVRAFNPKFPGIMDLPIWEIGKMWCKSQKPACASCNMNDLCPKSL
jgi:endonuclease III